MVGKAGLQRVGRQIKDLANRFQCEMTCGDAIVAAKHFSEDGARARQEPAERCGFLQCVPAFALGEALGWGGNS